MKLTFGEDVESFARSIDILRFEELDAVLSAAGRYLLANFKISKVERLVERVFRGVPNLEPTLDRDDQYEPYPVRDDNRDPFGLNAYAFVNRRNTWVVPENPQDTLDQSAVYRELWDPSHEVSLPRYVRLPDQDGQPRPSRPTRTLVSIPMVRRGSTTSLIYFESDEAIIASDRAKSELHRIAQAIARLYELAEQNKDTHRATGEEIKALDESSRVVNDWGIDVSSLFFGYSEDADEDVVAELQRQLRTLDEAQTVRLFDWKENAEGGRIPEKIEEEVRGATYFVGYLSRSQPVGAAPAYSDNPNVMYEAGMFQGLVTDVTQRAKNWLIVREPDSPEAPFDISTVNMLLVPRNEDGTLQDQELAAALGKRLSSLIPEAPA